MPIEENAQRMQRFPGHVNPSEAGDMAGGSQPPLSGGRETAEEGYVSALRARVADDKLLRGLLALCDALPDCEVIIEDVIAEGDKVAVRFTLASHRDGNDPDPVPGILLYRVAENKIVEQWVQPDAPVLLQVLEGAAP